MLAPTNLQELLVFLGMIRYYRQFFKDIAQLSGPLNHLQRDVPFNWEPAQQEYL